MRQKFFWAIRAGAFLLGAAWELLVPQGPRSQAGMGLADLKAYRDLLASREYQGHRVLVAPGLLVLLDHISQDGMVRPDVMECLFQGLREHLEQQGRLVHPGQQEPPEQTVLLD